MKLVSALRPESLLLIGSDPSALKHAFAALNCQNIETLPADSALTNLAKLGRYQCAVISGALECSSKTDGQALIAALRDVHSENCFVGIEMALASEWAHEDFIALGFRQAQSADTLHIYSFSLRDYKSTPDWLNPKDWANPEKWGKFRW